MVKALKIVGGIALALVVILAGALFVITRMIDPNDFKPDIAAAARDNANLELDIQGDLGWTFWPSLGVQIGRTEARLPGDEALFAGIDAVHLGVAVWPLLFGSVQMDDVLIDGLQLDLVEGPDGANWEKIGTSESTAAAAEPATTDDTASGGALDIPVSIPSLTINNANIRYRVLADGTDILVEQANISAQDLTLDQPFPLQVSLRYQDQSDMRIDTRLDTVLAMDLDTNRFVLSPLTVDADIAGVTTQPVSVSAKMNVDAALNDDRVAVTGLILQGAGTRTEGEITVSQLSTRMIMAGKLDTASFDANAALRAIGEAPIETSDPQALKNVSLSATLDGPENSIMVNPLVVRLDNSTLSGSAELADLDSGKIVFALTLDALAADGYLPPTTESTDETAGAVVSNESSGILPPLSEEALLPLEDLRSLLVEGTLKIGKLSYSGIEASDMTFAVTTDNGLMQLTQAEGNALDGSFKASAALDARTDTPVISLNTALQQVQLQPVAQLALEDDLFIGKLDMQLEFGSRGNSEKALVENAKGTTTFTLKDGTVRGANLHNTLVAGVNDMLGAYKELAAFIPGQESGKLPLELSEDTKIIDLNGRARIEKEIAYVDALDAQLNRGSVSGNGFLNLRSQQFDLKLGMKSPELTDNKYLKDQTWPMRCRGNLAGDTADWCRHDKDGFKAIGKDVAARAAKDRIAEKFGIEGEGETAEEVVKDAAKQKAKEEANKQLEEGLKKLFK